MMYYLQNNAHCTDGHRLEETDRHRYSYNISANLVAFVCANQ